MEGTTVKNTKILNDLIEINNDRIAGYTKSIDLLNSETDVDLISLFESYRQQSEGFKKELEPLVIIIGEEPREGTRLTGKLFRAWMDIKTAVAEDNRLSVLESCEKGEDTFKKVYDDARNNHEEVDERLLSILDRQGTLQLHAHDEIKALRDQESLKRNV